LSFPGSRIPEPFTVTDAMRQWAATEFPDVDIDWETDKFVNYYLAQPDECGGVKQDWGATWQLWIRRSTEMEWR
jgi:predicted 3-demethylubiquinone-9 3-methyltransferase (glyoxalase superfamily)